jgi:hypothetical protein
MGCAINMMAAGGRFKQPRYRANVNLLALPLALEQYQQAGTLLTARLVIDRLVF